MIDPVVRVASRDDVAELVALERMARAALVDARGGARWLDTNPEHGPSWWTTAVTAGQVGVGDLDGLVVGYLVLTIAGPVAHVAEVFVRPEARELGFGDGLIEWAEARGRASGCTLLEGEALPGDRDTKNLYERAGITARLITLSRRL